MARLARLYAPLTPHLVQVRFNQAVQQHPQQRENKLKILQWLEQSCLRYQLDMHALSLTSDSLYFLCSPDKSATLSQVVQAIGRHLATALRQGSVFEGRFRSCLVEPGNWLLASMIWLETHVQHSNGVVEIELLPWSSAGFHTGAQSREIPWLKSTADYWSLGNTPFERQARYRVLCQEGLSHVELEAIESALGGQWVLGSEAFVSSMEEVASRRVSPRRRGRPRKC